MPDEKATHLVHPALADGETSTTFCGLALDAPLSLTLWVRLATCGGCLAALKTAKAAETARLRRD